VDINKTWYARAYSSIFPPANLRREIHVVESSRENVIGQYIYINNDTYCRYIGRRHAAISAYRIFNDISTTDVVIIIAI